MHVTEFNTRNPEHDNQYTASLDPRSAYRKATTARRWANRSGGVAKDLDDMVSGRPKDPKKKRFYQKSWFQNMLLTGALASPIVATRGLAAARKSLPILPKWVNKSHTAGRPLFATKQRNVIHFSTYRNSDETRRTGWDVRDARGNSARVFTPDGAPRTRRKKKPGERVENIRKTRNIAIAAALAGAGGVAYLGLSRAALPAAVRTRLPAMLRRTATRAANKRDQLWKKPPIIPR